MTVTDQLTVEVERAFGYNGTDQELSQDFSRQLKSVTGVNARVAISPASALPRATHKAKCVEDQRDGVWE